MSYRINIDPRSSKAGRFIRRVHREIQKAFVASGLTQQQLAVRLGVNRATVNKRLLGEENLTLRSVADLAWAMEADLDFHMVHRDIKAGNMMPRASSAARTQIFQSTMVPMEEPPKPRGEISVVGSHA